jgi:hypothetical protein
VDAPKPDVDWQLEPDEVLVFRVSGHFAGRFEAEPFLAREYGNQLEEGGFLLEAPLELGGPLLVDAQGEAAVLAALRSLLGLQDPPLPGPRSRHSPLAER